MRHRQFKTRAELSKWWLDFAGCMLIVGTCVRFVLGIIAS